MVIEPGALPIWKGLWSEIIPLLGLLSSVVVAETNG